MKEIFVHTILFDCKVPTLAELEEFVKENQNKYGKNVRFLTRNKEIRELFYDLSSTTSLTWKYLRPYNWQAHIDRISRLVPSGAVSDDTINASLESLNDTDHPEVGW